jgi:hypothetical protein
VASFDDAGTPHELDGARVLKLALVTPDVRPTGATSHTVGGVGFGPVAALAIARYPDQDGTYLYLDDDGRAVTDMWHASLDDALHQAAFENEGLSWADISGV